MDTPTDQKQFSLTSFLVILLVVTLLAGAMLVRLVDDDDSPDISQNRTEATAGKTAIPDAPKSPGLPRPDNPAPDFTLLDLQDQPVNLSDWRGHPVLINFWATWCGPCEVEMPDIQAAYKAHQEDGLVVLAIAVEDNVNNARDFFEKHGLTFYGLMDDGTVSRAYQVFGLPTSFFVDSNGLITAVHTGLLTEGKIEEYLAQGQ